MVKALYVTGKLPFTKYNIDGGNKTTEEFIDILKDIVDLDVLFFTKDKPNEEHMPYDIKGTIWHKVNMENFNDYSDVNGRKFKLRMKRAKACSGPLLEYKDKYDVIIVQHVIFLFDLLLEDDIWDRIILLPMFSGESYKKSGELVPEEYIFKERAIYSRVNTIITPSYSEKQQLVDAYGVNENKIETIHRIINELSPRKEDLVFPLKNIVIVYIASIKKQKNTLQAVKLISILKSKGYNAYLYCLGNIQDESVYVKCLEYCKDNHCSENVMFSGNCNKEELKEYLEKSVINISVSGWETFGRGIYEGMMSYIPTIVLSNVVSVLESNRVGVLPIVVDNIEEMSESIIKLISDKIEYNKEVDRYKPLHSVMDKKTITERIRTIIYNNLATQ